MLMILWFPNQQRVAQLGFYIPGDLSSLDRSRRSGKDVLSEYLCMYMLVLVSSGSSVRIFIILGNLMIPGKILKVQ
jgi:hypothetical protein